MKPRRLPPNASCPLCKRPAEWSQYLDEKNAAFAMCPRCGVRVKEDGEAPDTQPTIAYSPFGAFYHPGTGHD